MTIKIRVALAAALISCAFATSALAAGAIAVNDEEGTTASDAGYGVGRGSTKKQAEQDAIKECKSVGNETCTVAVTYEQCGAYAGNKTHYGTGTGSTQKAAETAALADCPKCKLIVSDCQ